MDLPRYLRSSRFWWRLTNQFFASVGFFAILIGLFDVLFPNRIAPHGGSLLYLTVLTSALFGFFSARPRSVTVAFKRPKTEICVIIGDLFKQDGNLVIGMTDTFDTEIPHVIDRSSIQGQMLAKVYAGDCSAFDNDLERSLRNVEPIRTFGESEHKPGKQDIYRIGTVASILHSPRRHYFCLAYANMNKDNEARGTVDGVWASLSNLWDEARRLGNGDPVSIAVIGGGQARMSQHFPALDSIRLIALSFMFASRREQVSRRLNIAVLRRDADKLDFLEVQAFLKSLRES